MDVNWSAEPPIDGQTCQATDKMQYEIDVRSLIMNPTPTSTIPDMRISLSLFCNLIHFQCHSIQAYTANE